MATTITPKLFVLFFFYGLATGDFNVNQFGTKSDGKTDCGNSFMSAWAAACASNVPGTVYIPPGKYLLKPIVFLGPYKNTRILFQIDGTLVAPENYAAKGSASKWLWFDGVNGVSIFGGILDGQGTSLWACKTRGGKCPDGAITLGINNAMDIMISKVTSVNSKLGHMVIDNSKNVIVQGITIRAPGNSPNTDGLHVQQSMGVRIVSTGTQTGDDCVSIRPGTQNLWIEDVACGPGHGISIGSLGRGTEEAGVQNVTVKHAVFTGSDNGLRIKTWARQSNGLVRGVLFQDVVMQNVKNPIIIDQNYCPAQKGCPNQSSSVKITQVKYENIRGTSASKIAVNFDCSKNSPCQRIGLEDVKLTYQDQPAQSSCQHAKGTASGLVEPPSCL